MKLEFPDQCLENKQSPLFERFQIISYLVAKPNGNCLIDLDIFFEKEKIKTITIYSGPQKYAKDLLNGNLSWRDVQDLL